MRPDDHATVQLRLPGASPANVIAADLTPLPTVVSVLLIRMPIERRKRRLAPKDETSAECHTGAPLAVQAPADRVPEPQGEGAPAPCIDFLLRYSPLRQQQWEASCLSSLLHCLNDRILRESEASLDTPMTQLGESMKMKLSSVFMSNQARRNTKPVKRVMVCPGGP